MSLFPTKFVCDVGTLEYSSSDTLEATLSVKGRNILKETYSPANGVITVRGLRQVLEAAIYGELKTGSQPHAVADVALTIGNSEIEKTLYASRLRNPRDPQGAKTVMAAGDIVAVCHSDYDDFITDVLYTVISSGVTTRTLSYEPGLNGYNLGDGIRLWVDFTGCPERCVAVRFLNRYDVPQTMMTTQPLTVKPGFQDQTALMYGNRVRYTVDQQDEYTLRSGKIHSMAEYASWHDLITSRKAEVLIDSQWLPIIIKKSNFTAVRRSMGMNPVEISFQMADPRQGI